MFKKTKVCSGLMLAFGGTLIAASGQSLAQQQLERVEITGSSIKRLDTEGSLPVQLISREEIARSGVTNTEQLLQSLSSVSSSNGVNNATGAGSSTYGVSTVSLRGLGGFRTLVLVNGRRVVASPTGTGASVNVNAIPLAAIDRIEVLKDGASAVYGSDAVGGVINFILQKNFQGVELGATIGTPTRSGGGQGDKVSVVGGFGDLSKDRFSVTLSGSIEREKALFAKDREFAATGNQFPWLVAGATGQGNIEGAFVPGTGSVAAGNWKEGTRVAGFGASPGSGYGNPLAATDKCGDINMFKNPTPTSKGNPYCAFDSAAFVGLLPKREADSLSGNLVFKVSDAFELFGDGLYSKSTVTQIFQPSPVRRSFLTPADALFQKQGVDPALLIFPSNPNYKTAADYLNANGYGSLVGQPLAITSRVFDFGPRTSVDVYNFNRLVAGARGTVVGQDFELSYTRSEAKVTGTVPDGYFSQVEYAKIVQTSNDWNPWSLTQTAAFNAKLPAAKYTGSTLDAKSNLSSIDGKLTGDAFKLPAGTSQYAVGAQSRKETLEKTPSAALGTGDIAGLGGATAPISVNRKVTAFYGELNIPVLKGLDADVAARSDKYSDVGSSSTYKASIRWQPTSTIVLRSSLGTGFRAPTLIDINDPQVVGTSAQFTDPKFPNNPNLQVPQVSGGNPDLKPEKTKQQSIGIVFSPMKSLSVGVDLFDIKLKDIISNPSAQEVVSGFRRGDSSYLGLVKLDASGSVDQIKVISTNTGDAKISGVDLNVDYREKFAFGNMNINLNGTYFSKYDQTSPGGVISHKVGTIVDANGDPVLDADGGGVVLRWKHVLSATWSQGPWAATFAQNFYRGYETGFRQIDGEQNFVSDQAIYDAQIAFSGVKGLKLALGVKNLFDKNPPIFVPVSNQFQSGYDITQYDARARFVYVSANYKF
jgi:iron complex outermembrane recepter protein